MTLDKIINKKPNLTIVAGVNGAGKTTLINHYMFKNIPIVNPDVIAKERGCSFIEAGKMAILEREHFIKNKTSFAIETTLSGNNEIKIIEKAKNAGYKINLIYIGVDNALISFMRVEDRVLKGGHDVPTKDIFRRYDRSLANLPKALRLADRAYVFDNSLQRKLLYARRNNMEFMAERLPDWAQNKITKKINIITKKSSGMER